jgi:DNA-binding SARP family transcriptional activator/tetratricopeptide (TPR) repeat protein
MLEPRRSGRSSAARCVHLFGAMRCEDVGGTVLIPPGDSQRLVGYLALHRGGVHRREVVADALWPEHGVRGRRTLTDALYRFRRRVGDQWLDVTSDTVVLAPDVDVDVAAFDRAIADGADDDMLDEAVALHDAGLLPGVYDDWAIAEGTHRARSLTDALKRRAARRERNGDLGGALVDVRRQLSIEPLDEPAHEVYLRLLGKQRRHAEALAHFAELRRLLADELDSEPMPSTCALATQLERERPSIDAVEARTGPLIGRTEELGELLGAIDAMFALPPEHRGAVVCIEGVAGIGKTRLAAEAVRSARWRGATVLTGQARQVPGSGSLAPLARVMAPLLSGPRRLQIEVDLEPALVWVLGHLDPDGAPASVPTPAGNQALAIDHALRALGAVVARLEPTVLVLDDVHWAGPGTWDAIASFVAGFVAHGGLVVVAYRRAEIEHSPGWSILQRWAGEHRVSAIELGPLDATSVAAMARHAGGELDVLLAATGGVPFYIEQWDELAERDRPSSATDLVVRRFEGLEPSAQRALEAASVLGDVIELRVWLALTKLRAVEIAPIVDRLVVDRWIEPASAGYAFTHDLIRTIVAGRLRADVQQRLHRDAARAIAERDPTRTHALAYHLDRAGEIDEAIGMYRSAGAASVERLAFRDGVAAWSRALELMDDAATDERLVVLLDVARAREVLGEHLEQQRTDLEECVDLARRLDDHEALLTALLIWSMAATRIGDTDNADRMIAEARDLADELGDTVGLARAACLRGEWFANLGRWPDALAQFTLAHDLVDNDRDDHQQIRARVLRGLSASCLRMARPLDALGWLEQASSLYDATGDRVSELATVEHFLAVYYELGWLGRLIETVEAALPLARTVGNDVNVAVLLHALGVAKLSTGDRHAADEHLAAGQAAFERAGRSRNVALSIATRGLVAFDDGDDARAESLFREAIDLADELGASTEVGYASHDLGRLLIEAGRPSEALAPLRRSIDVWRSIDNALMVKTSEAYLALALDALGGHRDDVRKLAATGLAHFRGGSWLGEHPEVWLWALTRVLESVGEVESATETLRAAYDETLRQAATFDDAVQRRGFLERVPVHRAIVEAMDRAIGSDATTVVRLAHVDAPLGRALQPGEWVAVRWTVHAPDDELVADGGARRRHRLRRLLAEAESASAVPTDDDLAAALGVSRRTVLRDIDHLRANDEHPTTRRRRP